jgi:hypothetical protein
MELIEKIENQTYYQLDFKIKKGATFTIKEIFEDGFKFTEDWELDDNISDSVDKICISDAHTHTERLVFPAFYVRNKTTGERRVYHSYNQIAGKMTMMIHGGDPSTVKDHKVYVRWLRRINK